MISIFKFIMECIWFGIGFLFTFYAFVISFLSNHGIDVKVFDEISREWVMWGIVSAVFLFWFCLNLVYGIRKLPKTGHVDSVVVATVDFGDKTSAEIGDIFQKHGLKWKYEKYKIVVDNF